MSLLSEEIPPNISYNPFRIPPSLTLCQQHYKSTQFGPTIKESSPCPCCYQKQKGTLGICCKTTAISQIQPTTGYFMFLIKSLIGLIITIAVVYGIFTFSSTISMCNNQPEKCVKIDFLWFSIPFMKTTDQASITYKLLSVLTLAITVIYILFMQYYLLKKQNRYLNLVRPGDYSILLSGVDHAKVKKADIALFFKNEGIQNVQILYTHQIGKYLEAEREKALLQTKLEYCLSKGLMTKQVYKYKEELKIVQESINPIINKFFFNQQQSIRTDKIFVSFDKFQEREAIIQKYNQGGFRRIISSLTNSSTIVINDVNLIIEQLAQPTHIIWQNLQIKSKERIIRILVGNMATGFILVIAFGLILVLSHLQTKEQGTTSLDKFYSYMCAFGITIINLILSYLVHYIARKERRFTTPGVVNALMVNQTISFFISTALMPVSMLFIFKYNPDVDSLISNVISIFTVNSFVTSITVIFNLEGIYKKFMRTRLLGRKTFMTQYQANQYFQKIHFEVDFKFALISKLGFLALFYGGAFPIGLVVSVIGLSIYYWTIKFMLVKQSQMIDTSFKTPKRMNKLLCFLPVVFCSGQLINQLIINKQFGPFNIILFIVSIGLGLFLCAYSREIVKRVMKKYGALVMVEKPTRTQALKEGMVDYKHVNPTSYQERKHSQLIKSTDLTLTHRNVVINGTVMEEDKIPNQIKAMSLYISKNPNK